MGFFSGLIKTVAPIAGAAFGGPLGGMAGAALGGLVGKEDAGRSIGNQIGSAIGDNWQSYSSAQRVEEGQQAQNQQQQANFERSMDFNAQEAARARDFNASEAAKSRDWQAQQSATQYQRAVGDMEAAGLNPMLAYSQGGAGNLAGATASAGAASASGSGPNLPNPVGAGLSTAIALKSANATADLNTALAKKAAGVDTEASIASTSNIRQQTKNLVEENWRIIKDAGYKAQATNTEIYKQELIQAQRDLAYAEEQYKRGQISMQEFVKRQEAAKATILETEDVAKAKSYGDFWRSGFGKAYPYTDAAAGVAGSAIGSALGVKRLFGK